MARPRKDPGATPIRRAPATTPEVKENQLISLAIDMAEEQLSNRTAPTQVMVHYLKLATTREKKEQEKIHRENLLLQAKVDQLQSMERQEELYSKALNAMREYSGRDNSDDYYDD